jgi:hypothetical protein
MTATARDQECPTAAADAPALVRMLARVVGKRRKEGAADGDLLFPNRLGKMRSRKKAHRAVYTAANVAMIWNHDYRRTFASHTLHLTHNGELIAPVTVMRWIGHASLDLTLKTYARDLPNEWSINRGSHLDFSLKRYERMPTVQLADAGLARELILRACEVHGAAPGSGIHYMDGALFEPGFSLEGVAAFAWATERYIRETGDDQIVEEPVLADTLYASADDLAGPVAVPGVPRRRLRPT